MEILNQLREAVQTPGVIEMMLALVAIGGYASAYSWRKAYAEGMQRGYLAGWVDGREDAENEYRVVPLHPAVV